MYRILTIFVILYAMADCATYQRYGDTTGSNAYSTMSNLYPQSVYPYKNTNYGSDTANYPDVSRYPSYTPGLSTPGTGSGYNKPGYGVGTPRYGQDYGGYSSFEMPFMKDMRDNCVNRSPQMGIFVDNLMGMWYGVEYVEHLAGEPRVHQTRSCIVIHIAEPIPQPSTENQVFHVQHINAQFRQRYRHLRLLWDEAGQSIEYALYFRNDTAGYWQVYDGQNVTLTKGTNYQQFNGTIQVLKAVQDKLVLHFCQEAAAGRPAQLYSVLFSRFPERLSEWDTESIHTMLLHKQLLVGPSTIVCENSSDRDLLSVLNLFLNLVLNLLAYAVGSS